MPTTATTCHASSEVAFASRPELDHDACVPSGPQATDVALVIHAARGDRIALAELYERHATVMGALAIRILRDVREAEDVLHDVFVEAWQHAGDYDPARCSVRGWLLLRVRSRCLDRLRRQQRKRDLAQASHPAPAIEGAEPWADIVDSARVHDALSRLNAEQRNVLELGYFHGFSSREIADRLDIPIGTVKSRVSAALARLRRELSDAFSNGAEP